MEQLLWLAEHSDLSAAIGEAKRETDPLARLAAAARLSGYRRDFTLTTRLDRLATAMAWPNRCAGTRPSNWSARTWHLYMATSWRA